MSISGPLLMVNNLYAPRQVGGAEKSVQLLAESLAEDGHAIHVLTLVEAEVEPSARSLNGVTVHEWPIANRHWPFGAPKRGTVQRLHWHWNDIENLLYDDLFDGLIDTIRPAVVHTHNLAGFSTRIWRLAQRRGISVVHTLRDYYLSCPSSTRYRNEHSCARTCFSCRPFETVRRKASDQVDAVVGISRFILDDHLHRRFFPAAAERRVIPNSFEPRLFKRTAPADTKTCTLGYLGMLTPAKGIEVLLEVFCAVAPHDCLLLVGGDGDAAYISALKSRHQHPGIRYLGFVDPMVIYAQVDAVVVPSRWHEPFSRVAMEAATYGIPLLAADRGGLSEIAAKVDATLFDPDKPASLAKALTKVIAGRIAAGRPETAASHRIASAFDLKARAQDYLDVYRALQT